MDLMYAEMSLAQFVMVVVVHLPLVVLNFFRQHRSKQPRRLTYPELPLQRGSFASSQAKMPGSFT